MENKKVCIEIAKRNSQSVIMVTDLKGNVIEYVGCSYFDNRKPYGEKWQWGHYYGDDVKGAMDWLYDIPKMPIPYERLSELATLFKDGLIEDGKSEAMEYFTKTCEMTEEELKYFGLSKRKYKLVEVELEKTIRTKTKILVPQDENNILWNWDEYIESSENLDYNVDLSDESWEYRNHDVIREEMTAEECNHRYNSDEVWNYDDFDEE